MRAFGGDPQLAPRPQFSRDPGVILVEVTVAVGILAGDEFVDVAVRSPEVLPRW